jgi:hypothetical protein
MQNVYKLSGLLFSCPLNIRDSECPFNSIWSMSIDERIEFINELNGKEIFRIMEHHKMCLTIKERNHLITSNIN